MKIHLLLVTTSPNNQTISTIETNKYRDNSSAFTRQALTLLTLLLLTTLAWSQDDGKEKKEKKQGMGIGLKGGLNFANVTNASSINSTNETGFMVGIFLNPPAAGVMSYRTELIFSKQGYNYSDNTNTGTVNLNYIILPQLMGINIGKVFQLQLGGQMAYLLNAKVDSTKSTSSTDPTASIMEYYNRFDFGAAAGFEIYPFKGIMIGARYNISFGNMYKDMAENPGTMPSFIPKVDVKNNVVQFYAGYRF